MLLSRNTSLLGDRPVPLAVHSHLARALRATADKRLSSLESVIRAYPDHGLSWLALAEARLHGGLEVAGSLGAANGCDHIDASLDALALALTHDRDLAKLHLARADVGVEDARLYRPGARRGQRESFLIALFDARDQENRRQSLRCLRRLLSLHPEHPAVIFHFALASARAGNTDHAKWAESRLRTLAPARCFLFTAQRHGYWPSAREYLSHSGQLEESTDAAIQLFQNAGENQTVLVEPRLESPEQPPPVTHQIGESRPLQSGVEIPANTLSSDDEILSSDDEISSSDDKISPDSDSPSEDRPGGDSQRLSPIPLLGLASDSTPTPQSDTHVAISPLALVIGVGLAGLILAFLLMLATSG